MSLANCPLAKKYNWTPPKRDTGGVLYLYPPTSLHRSEITRLGKRRENKKMLDRERVFAINPHDLTSQPKTDEQSDPITRRARVAHNNGWVK